MLEAPLRSESEATAAIPEDEVGNILCSFRRWDFAVVNFDADATGHVVARALQLTTKLGLGKAYVPKLYRSQERVLFSSVSGLNDVGGPSATKAHPSFSRSAALDLHTDGTLEPIGKLATSILLCLQDASCGGETVIVRTSAVFEELWSSGDEHLRSCLRPLCDARALRRWETVRDGRGFADGPVFEPANDGRFVTRYCTSPRDEWRYDAVAGLAEARACFDNRMRATGERFEIALAPGELLLLNNRRVSHGRNGFTSFPGSPRHLLRGLFLAEPRGT